MLMREMNLQGRLVLCPLFLWLCDFFFLPAARRAWNISLGSLLALAPGVDTAQGSCQDIGDWKGSIVCCDW